MQETQETWVPSLGQEDPLEKGMATHFIILAWKIPWTKKPDNPPQSCKYVWNDLATKQQQFYVKSKLSPNPPKKLKEDDMKLSMVMAETYHVGQDWVNWKDDKDHKRADVLCHDFQTWSLEKWQSLRKILIREETSHIFSLVVSWRLYRSWWD